MPPRAAAVAAGKNKQRKSSSPKVKADLDASATQLQRRLEQEKAWSEEATSMALFPAHRTFLLRCIKLRDAAWFQGGVIGVIFLAGILVAIQTYPIPPKSTATRVLHVLDQIVLWIFVIEIVVKLAAAGKKPWKHTAYSRGDQRPAACQQVRVVRPGHVW